MRIITTFTNTHSTNHKLFTRRCLVAAANNVTQYSRLLTARFRLPTNDSSDNEAANREASTYTEEKQTCVNAPMGFELTTPVFQRSKTVSAPDRQGDGNYYYYCCLFWLNTSRKTYVLHIGSLLDTFTQFKLPWGDK
jgi:hypothetical protein